MTDPITLLNHIRAALREEHSGTEGDLRTAIDEVGESVLNAERMVGSDPKAALQILRGAFRKLKPLHLPGRNNRRYLLETFMQVMSQLESQ